MVYGSHCMNFERDHDPIHYQGKEIQILYELNFNLHNQKSNHLNRLHDRSSNNIISAKHITIYIIMDYA